MVVRRQNFRRSYIWEDIAHDGALRSYHGPGFEQLSSLTRLTRLDVSGSPISSRALKSLEAASGLLALNVAGCFITSPHGLGSICRTLSNLVSLDLSTCK